MKDPKASKKRLPSIVRWILWVLLVQFILINISAALYAYRFTHFYDDPSLLEDKPDRNIFTKTWKLFTGPRQPRSAPGEKPGFAYETVMLNTKSGIPIEAWYARTDTTSKGTVVLFHGIINNKSRLLDEAWEFRSMGYNIMLVDFRGHGGSGGNSSTLGVREPEEVLLAHQYLESKGEQRIYLYGSSLGAVVVAKAVSDYQLRVTGIILEMPFLSLQSYLRARARGYGFSGQQGPFAFLTTFWLGVENGYNGYRHRTTRYAKNVTCPVLMQCGAQDQFVPIKESEKIFEAIGSAEKKLVVYPAGQHESFLRHDPLKWRIEVERFLGR